MPKTATLERGNTTVEIELLSDASQTPLVSRDFGKPHLQFQQTGSINPRFIDAWSGLEQYTITGRFTGSTAYDDAISFMDLIKSNSNGNQLTLNVDMPEYDTDIPVVPSAGQDAAATVNYNPGWRDYVEVDLALTRANTQAGADQSASTPTAAGSGPVELSDGTTTVELTPDVTVSRSVGRPQSTVRRTPSAITPNHYDKFKTAYDAFELSFEIVENTQTLVDNIISLFDQQLLRSPLTLDFNGLFGMGSFNVAPDGSQALRVTRVAGEQGTNSVPTINLRRVI